MVDKNSVIPIKIIERKILLLREKEIMLDRDLAVLYGVRPIALRQQVKRNIERFPEDFMFRLSDKESNLLVSQNVIPSKKSLGGSLPYAFTQEGIAMLSSVLRSKQAVMVNIQIMRVFVRMREMLESNVKLAQSLKALEDRMDDNDVNVIMIMQTLRKLIGNKQRTQKQKIGFNNINGK